MNFQPITLRHIPIGISIPFNLLNLRGELVLKKGAIINTFEEQIRFLAQPLFVNEEDSPNSIIPQDQYVYFASHPILFIEHLHDFLFYSSKLVQLPFNFQDIIFEKSSQLSALNQKFSSLMLMHCYLHSHPGNAILNAIQTALLCDFITKKMCFSTQETLSVTAAALTMNLTLFELQDFLSSHGRAPTQGERISILNHPNSTCSLLESSGANDRLWLDLVLTHHEEPSGKGYPAKLTKEQIPELAHALRLTDRFVALMTSRNTRAGMTPEKAFIQLQEPHAGFNIKHLDFLINQLSPFPPGSLLKKQNTSNQTIFFCLKSTKEKTIIMNIQGNVSMELSSDLISAGSPFDVLYLDNVLYSTLRTTFLNKPTEYCDELLQNLLN